MNSQLDVVSYGGLLDCCGILCCVYIVLSFFDVICIAGGIKLNLYVF